MACSYRYNPAASLLLQQIYGNPVLFSGLGSLVMSDQEAKDIICNLQRLLPCTPNPFIYFMAGTLPTEALLHKTQLSLFSMITRLPSSILHGHAQNIFNFVTQSRKSCFLTIRDLCLKYQLDYPPNREQFKLLVKKRFVNYWNKSCDSRQPSYRPYNIFILPSCPLHLLIPFGPTQVPHQQK